MIRKAQIKDINQIHEILSQFGDAGELLPRPLSGLYDHIRDFSVYVTPEIDQTVGCCALQICWEDIAEIRSLAVEKYFWGKKIGTQLTQNALEEARAFGLRKVFTLTYRPKFFEKLGFKIISRNDLPLKIWGDCILCVKYPDCDETAMAIQL